MGVIKGRSVLLTEKSQTGTDALGAPVYEERLIEVENVIIEPASNEAVTNDYTISGKRLAYVLHIPKDDNHVWTDTKVHFYGKTFKTYGDVLTYDERLTPLDWNKKVKVELYG